MAGHFWAIRGTSTHIYSPMFHSLKNEMIQQWDNSNFIHYIVYSDNIRTILYFVPLQMDFIPETNWDRDLNAPGAQASRGTCSEHGSGGPSRSDVAKSVGLGDTTWLFCSNEWAMAQKQPGKGWKRGIWSWDLDKHFDFLAGCFVCVFVCSVSPDLSWNIWNAWHPEASFWDATEAIPLSALAGKQNLFGKRWLNNPYETKKHKGLNGIHRWCMIERLGLCVVQRSSEWVYKHLLYQLTTYWSHRVSKVSHVK